MNESSIAEASDLLSIDQVIEMVPAVGGRRPTRGTVQRWIAIGVCGVKLGATKVGMRLGVPRDSVVAFLAALQNDGGVEYRGSRRTARK